MKKTLTTLLILTLVASVCGVMFASASDPVEELKAELEALVGAEANADFEWAMDVTTNEDGTVTVVLTVEGIEGKAVNYVYGDLYYNEDELILLTGKNQLDGVDCLTSAPAGFDNLTVMKPGVKGAIELNICNPLNLTPLKDGDLVLTLTFKLAKGVTLAGLYIPTASVEGAANVDAVTEFPELNGNGAYGIAYLEVKEESSEPTDPSDETTVPGESSTTPSTPDDSSEETSVPGESSTTPSEPDDSSEETSDPAESSTTPAESSTTPAESSAASSETSEDGPGDSGVLLFMVLGLLAVAGAAVAIKVRG